MLYARGADLVAITHAAFIAFLLVGGFLAWRWPRLVWAHLPSVVLTAMVFAFGAYEKQDDTRPLNTFRSNAGGEPVGGNITRVLTSDLSALSSFVSTNFKYDTGAFDNVPRLTPGKPWMLKGDYNVNSANKVTFRYNQLASSTDVNQSGSSSIGTSRQTLTTNFLTFANSNYQILENLKSGVGEWNSVFGTFTNNLLIGHTWDMYGQMAVYLRLNGLVPPASQRP